MHINKQQINRILCYAFVFLVLFQPLILPFNVLHLLSVISITILFFHRKDVVFVLQKQSFLWFIGFNFLYFIYASAVSLFTGSFISGFYSGFLFAVELPLCVLTAYVLCKKNDLSLQQTVIHAGLIQAVIAIAVLFIPGLQNAVINLYISRGFPVETEWFIGKRFFGFSSQLTFAMPMVQTILAILVLHNLKSKKNVLKSLLYVFLFLVSAIINARNTLVILIVGIVYLVFDKFAYLKKIKPIYYLYAFGGIAVVAVVGYFISPATFTWITQGLSEIFFIFTGSYEGSYFDIIFSNFFFFPETVLSFIFGSGINVFNQTVNGMRSDVGFIIDLWYAGIIGCILKYTGTVGALLKNVKKDSFIVFLLLTLFAANVKGIAFENNELMAFISFYILCHCTEEQIEN